MNDHLARCINLNHSSPLGGRDAPVMRVCPARCDVVMRHSCGT